MIVTLSTCMSKAVNLGKCTWQWRSIGSSPKTWSLWRPRLQWESTVASGNQRWQWRILVKKTSFFGTFPSHVWLPKVRGNVWQMTLLRRRTWFSKPKLAYIDTSLWHAHTTCTYTNICPYVSIYIYIYTYHMFYMTPLMTPEGINMYQYSKPWTWPRWTRAPSRHDALQSIWMCRWMLKRRRVRPGRPEPGARFRWSVG